MVIVWTYHACMGWVSLSVLFGAAGMWLVEDSIFLWRLVKDQSIPTRIAIIRSCWYLQRTVLCSAGCLNFVWFDCGPCFDIPWLWIVALWKVSIMFEIQIGDLRWYQVASWFLVFFFLWVCVAMCIFNCGLFWVLGVIILCMHCVICLVCVWSV